MLGRLEVVFNLICILLAMYMVATQMLRHTENRDTSSIHIKQFDGANGDNYPSFSLCFHGDELNWYRDTSIFYKFWLERDQFIRILQGRSGFVYEYDRFAGLYHKYPIDIRNISDANIDEFSLNATDLLTRVTFVGRNSKLDVSYGSNIQNMQRPPIYISHQTSDVICFTRDSKIDVNSLRSMDVISLVRSLISHGTSKLRVYDNVEFRIIFHYPGQLLRSYHRPAYKTKLQHYNPDNVLEMRVLQTTKFIRRPNAKDPCNPNLQDDDAQFRMEIIRRIRCVPIYWRRFEAEYNEFSDCSSQQTLKQADDYINSFQKVLSSYDPPCVEMNVLAVQSANDEKAFDEFIIRFLYIDDTYYEVQNVEEFGFESFWSSVGGFVGIFLGYSLLQLPQAFKALALLSLKLIGFSKSNSQVAKKDKRGRMRRWDHITSSHPQKAASRKK